MPAYCGHCGREDSSLKCSRCKSVRYCDRSCQRAAWKAGHKAECVPVPACDRAGETQGAAASGAVGARCLIIDALPLDASVEQIRAGIRPFLKGGLPLEPANAMTEAREKQVLRRELRWRDVQGLFGYSEKGLYKDLYIYFDYADTASAPNELATKAFRMYGLGGAMGEPNWTRIRGPAIVVRGETPTFGGGSMSFGGVSMSPPTPSFDFKPIITVDEMTRTLCFFRDHKRSAQRIASARDAQRLTAGSGMGGGGTGMYFGPTGCTRPLGTVMGRDTEACDHCGATAATLGRPLKTCQTCHAAKYCSLDCQKAAWKGGHKQVCTGWGKKGLNAGAARR